jgi:tRNA A37 threonylcarbamoyladenosine synthetase subunit TsaC/SUA5/YrdC
VIAQSLLATLGEPMMSVTMILPGDELPLLDPYEIRSLLQSQVDLVIDGGYCGMEATSIVDLSGESPVILRRGAGSLSEFES